MGRVNDAEQFWDENLGDTARRIFTEEKDTMTTTDHDPVNHPQHYQGAGGMEAIDVIEAFLGLEGAYYYCRGNALKYELRAGAKGYAAQDHRKAAWYAERAATLWDKITAGDQQ